MSKHAIAFTVLATLLGCGKHAADPASVTLVDYDLTKAGSAWTGWTMQGPEKAKVMDDLIDGARLGVDGWDSFDVLLAPKDELADIKSRVDKSAADPAAKTTLTYTTSTPDKLEWKTRRADGKRDYFGFATLVHAAGATITCGSFADTGDAAMVALGERACATVHKK